MAASDPMTELVERILWPKLDDARAAKKAARQGAYYAFFVVGLYAISVIRHLTRPTENLFKFDGSAYVIRVGSSSGNRIFYLQAVTGSRGYWPDFLSIGPRLLAFGRALSSNCFFLLDSVGGVLRQLSPGHVCLSAAHTRRICDRPNHGNL